MSPLRSLTTRLPRRLFAAARAAVGVVLVAAMLAPGQAAAAGPSIGTARTGDGSSAVAAGGSVAVVSAGARSRKVVALTFDDGWGPAATAAIVAILEREHVPATFFPYARAVRQHPALWRSIARAGFPIGNHTDTHPNLTRLSLAGQARQVLAARRSIESIIGMPTIDALRPPYGAWNSGTRVAAARAGYTRLVLWDVDTRDWSGITPATIVARATRGRSGSIILMHAGPPATPRALPAIIASYRSRGFSFTTVADLLAGRAPAPPPAPTPMVTTGGRHALAL